MYSNGRKVLGSLNPSSAHLLCLDFRYFLSKHVDIIIARVAIEPCLQELWQRNLPENKPSHNLSQSWCGMYIRRCVQQILIKGGLKFTTWKLPIWYKSMQLDPTTPIERDVQESYLLRIGNQVQSQVFLAVLPRWDLWFNWLQKVNVSTSGILSDRPVLFLTP